jgi:Methyltransferase domain
VTGEPPAARIEQLAREAQQNWGSAYGRFAGVVSRFELRRGAEIGVAFGGHAESLLRESATELLYGVDPYAHAEGYDDPMNLPQDDFDALHDFTLRRLAAFGERFRLLRTDSISAAARVDAPLDYVYIDAVHTCEGVWSDVSTWAPLIRAGGIVGGHDYGHVDFPGVKRAVDEFCSRTGSELSEAGEGVWWTRLERPVDRDAVGHFHCRRSVGERVSRHLRALRG